MGNAGQAWVSAVMAVVALAPAFSAAQIRTDSSLGRAGQTLAGPQFTIPETLGSLRGSNLFHSFSVFNIATGESANFTTATRGIANVISRVTGGDASIINGTLRLTPADGTPGFFFINPAGVTFGAGASLDVPGAFHVSTADYVKFPDGVFHASASAQSTLSSAPPEAFGFLGTGRGTIAVIGGARLSTALLQPFSIVASDVTLDNGRATARAGDIRVVALGGGPAEVSIDGPVPAAHGALLIMNGGEILSAAEGATSAGKVKVAAGDIQILSGGLIDSSTSSSGNAGSVSISASNLLIERGDSTVTGIFSNASPGSSGNAGLVDVQVAGTLTVRDGGNISTGTLSSGNAGAITVRAGDIVVDGRGVGTTGIASQAQSGSTGNAGSVLVHANRSLSVLDKGQISTSTFGAGTGGALTIEAGAVRVFNGGLVISNANSTGNAGSIKIDAATVVIDGNAGLNDATSIVSNAQSGSGNGGSIEINATQSVSILNGGSILSHSHTSGKGGEIRINAPNMLLDSMGHEENVTTVASNTYGGTGDAGTIFITVPQTLTVLNGGEISSSTFSRGNASSVTVNAGNIVIDGQNYTRWATGIFSVADSGTGNAGTVNITAAGDMLLRHGGSVASGTFSPGHAGEVHVTARNLTLDGEGRYTPIASNSSIGATGAAGTVDIQVAEQLAVLDRGFIGSSTFSSGNAGSVRVRAADILVDGRTSGNSASISSQANEGTGNAGSVDVAASGSLVLLRNATITSSTFSAGDAGAVNVSAGTIYIEGRDASELATGILSNSYDGGGNAGRIQVSAVGALDIRGEGEISTSTYTAGNAGTISIHAGSMTIDGRGDFAGVFSQAIRGRGNAGTISVAVDGSLSITDRGQINSSTFSSGNAGEIRVSAGEISIDAHGRGVTGIINQAERTSSGNAGSIQVTTAGQLSIYEGGVIGSSTFASGKAGAVIVRAGDMLVDGRNHNSSLTGVASQADRSSSGDAGNLQVIVEEGLVLRDGGAISSSTFSRGAGGDVNVSAGHVLIDRQGADNPTGILSQAYAGSTGNAGTVQVAVRDSLEMLDGGVISSGTFAAGNAGAVHVRARDISMASPTTSRRAGIFSQAESGSTGDAGTVEVSATGTLSIRNEGFIGSSTFAKGNAGSVAIDAGRLEINGEGYVTGIVSEAQRGSTGNAGTVDVRVAGDILLQDGGQIASSTYGPGNAGSIHITADNITAAYSVQTFARPETTGIFSLAQYDSRGNAGTIDIAAAGKLSLIAGGLIDSTTRSTGRGGTVRVNAEDIVIDGLSEGQPSFRNTGIYSRAEFSRGNAGSVEVSARRSLLVNYGGLITSDTYSAGNAGSVTVSAPTIMISGGEFAFVTGIASRAANGSGNAGTVRVEAPASLSILNAGQITSSTASIGSAGSVEVHAGSLLVDGDLGFGQRSTITARAEMFSSGQTGNLTVTAQRITLSNGGELSITNAGESGNPAALRPGLLSVAAPIIELRDGGSITAASTGNVGASNIHVDVGSLMTLTNSAVTTSAVEGNGGAITVVGDGVLVLRDAQITTSVSGLRGNGGDISIGTAGLVMDTGFIQANTAAADATGGNVAINVRSLVTSGGSLFVGGSEPLEFRPGVFGLNVIQAAAPTGVSGAINITTPALDISGGLVGLNANLLDTGGLGRSLCELTGGSSLAQAGRGGMPASGRDFARAETANGAPPLAMASLDRMGLPRLSCWR